MVQTLEQITEEYNKYKIIPLTFDYVFKSIFMKNPEILKIFLIDVLKLDLEYEKSIIKIFNVETTKDNHKEHKKIVDALVSINDEYFIDIEVNRSYYKIVRLRNNRYFAKLIDILVEQRKDYKKLREVKIYQLNLNAQEKGQAYNEGEIVYFDKISSKIITENEKIFSKYLENYRELYYNGDKKRETIWLAFLTSRSIQETYSILLELNDKELVKKIVREVKIMNDSVYAIHEWENEKLAAYERYNEICYAKEEGLSKGRENGFRQIISSMLKNGFSVKNISQMININEKEINKIMKIKK